MAEFLYRLGRSAARHARWVVTTWIAVLALAAGAFLAFGGSLVTSFSIPGTPTQEVSDRLAEEFPDVSGGTGTIVFSADGEITQEQQDQIAEVLAEVEAVDGVERVVNPFETEAMRAEQAAQVTDGAAQIETAREELDAGQQQLDQASDDLDSNADQLAAGRAELEAQAEQLAAAIGQAEAAGGVPAELAAQQEQLEAGLAELDAGQAQIDAGREELAAQQAQIDEGRAELDTQAAALSDGEALLEVAENIRQVSADGSAALATVSFTEAAMDIPQETKDAVQAAAPAGSVEGVEISFSTEIAQSVPNVFGVGEVIGLVVAAIALFVMLGTLIGAGLPLLTALIGVGIGALAALSLSGVVEMASVTPILGVMLGLAVGIDYALFIVNRHRTQLKHGYDVEESIALANGTSGNAVTFAGMTVLVALLALNVTGIPFLALMGTVGALCILVAVLIAITLTPALLHLVGARILSRKERARLAADHPDPEHPEDVSGAPGSGKPLAPMSTPRAILRALGGIAVLLVIAIPALDLRLGLPTGASEPHDSTQYQAYSTIEEKFGEGQNGTLLVIADLDEAPADDAALAADQLALAQQLYALEDVDAVAPIGASEDNLVLAFQVIPAEGPLSESTEALVHELRETEAAVGSSTFAVAGSASGNIDISETLASALPVYLAVVVGLSLLILLLVFRSIFVPLIATAGFVLSFFAALGGVVAIYQWGWLSGIFGVETPGPVLNFLPTLLVGILFGLAMDYMLFIGSGMREAYAHGAPSRLAVVQGLRAGRSVVAAAAIIMIAVFGGFVFSHSAMIRPIGFALAFGVLVDAFVVRMLIIPALMHLLGDAAWWLPRWLQRILPDVDVEGAKLERRHPHVAAEASVEARGENSREPRSDGDA